MKKLLFTAALAGAIALNTNAQVTFQKTFGETLNNDYGYSVQQTTDGGYIITGFTLNFGAGNEDVYLIKTDANGDTLWTKTYGGTLSDYGYSVQQTADGGYIITGHTNSFGDIWGDVYLIKTDINGDTLWTKTYGGTNTDYGYSVQQTTDGGYVITGYTESFGAGLSDAYLIKTDSIGDTLWTKSYGGTSQDRGRSVQQTTDGGYIITGHTNSFGAGMEDVYLIKTNLNGDTLWTKTYGGTDSDYGYSVQQTTDGGYIITGCFNCSGAGGVYLVKTNVNGDTLWTKSYGGIAGPQGPDQGRSVQQTADNGYIITGYTWNFAEGNEDVYLIKTNANGDTLWTRNYGGGIFSDYGYSVQQTADGGYIITGFYSTSLTGTIELCLIKTDVNGNIGCANINIPNTIVKNLSTLVGSGGTVNNAVTIVNNPATIVGNTTTEVIDIFSVVPQPICLITVDSTSTKNVIVWEKPAVNNIAYFNIYKEGIVAFQYNLIGTVPFDSSSIFLDNASDPKVQAYRYKISTVDTCGNESLLSDSNKTIHLAITLGIPPAINLIIDGYEGFNFPTYYIWGGNAGGMNIIDTINSTLPQYTVLNPGPTDSLFFLELLHPTGCTTALAKVLVYNSARSNVSNRTIPTGISNPSLQVGMGFNVYPNPYTGKTEIYYNLTQKDNVTLEVLNVLGKKVKTIVNKVQYAGKYQYKFAGSETENSSGIFILKLIVNDKVYTKRLVNF